MLFQKEYIDYITSVRRYSPRTCEIYEAVLKEYEEFSEGSDMPDFQVLRNYEVFLLDGKGETPSTVNLHLSVLSGYCRFLVRKGALSSNPVSRLSRPRSSQKLPVFYRESSMQFYFQSREGVLEYGDYPEVLDRMIIGLLYSTGIRRGELISLNRGDVDFGRSCLRVKGKGDKMREIPLTATLCKEISLYLQRLSSLKCACTGVDAPLLQTPKGARLYPVFVDRAVKREMSGVMGVTGRRSPHVLRHTLATELLNNGADINSIKELLGHSSLAATQVYTHNTMERLKKVYKNAHPRAKNGGKHGD